MHSASPYSNQPPRQPYVVPTNTEGLSSDRLPPISAWYPEDVQPTNNNEANGIPDTYEQRLKIAELQIKVLILENLQLRNMYQNLAGRVTQLETSIPQPLLPLPMPAPTPPKRKRQVAQMQPAPSSIRPTSLPMQQPTLPKRKRQVAQMQPAPSSIRPTSLPMQQPTLPKRRLMDNRSQPHPSPTRVLPTMPEGPSSWEASLAAAERVASTESKPRTLLDELIDSFSTERTASIHKKNPGDTIPRTL